MNLALLVFLVGLVAGISGQTTTTQQDVVGTWPTTSFPLNNQTLVSGPDYATTSRTTEYTTSTREGFFGWFQRVPSVTITELQRTFVTWIVRDPVIGPPETRTVTVSEIHTATITSIAPAETVTETVSQTIHVVEHVVSTATRTVTNHETATMTMTNEIIQAVPPTATQTVTATHISVLPVVQMNGTPAPAPPFRGVQREYGEPTTTDQLALFVGMAECIQRLVPRDTSPRDAALLLAIISRALQEALQQNFNVQTRQPAQGDNIDVRQLVDRIAESAYERSMEDNNLGKISVKGVMLESVVHQCIFVAKQRLILLLADSEDSVESSEEVLDRGRKLVKVIGLGKAVFAK